MAEDHRTVSGTIARIVFAKGFGFVKRADGDVEFFFHRSAVEGVPFEMLRTGQAVRFEESTSTRGPRANRVIVA